MDIVNALWKDFTKKRDPVFQKSLFAADVDNLDLRSALRNCLDDVYSR